MLKMTEINKMNLEGIQSKLVELRKEVFDYNLQKNTSSLEKPHLLKNVKKDIARLETIASFKKRESK